MYAALAAVVLLTASGGAAFEVWRERQAERAELQRAKFETDLARQETARVAAEAELRDEKQDHQAGLDRNRDALIPALDRCEAALRASDAATAALAMKEVEKRGGESGTESLASRVTRCRADLAMLEGLDRIDEFRWTPVRGRYPDAASVAGRWGNAFAGFGIACEANTPADVARRVTESLISERLLMVLERWLLMTPSESLTKSLITITDKVNPDEYREVVMAAIVGTAEHMQKILASAAKEAQLPRCLLALGDVTGVPAEQMRGVLERAAVDRPGDFHLLMMLGKTYPINQRDGAVERIRWFQAATAIRPQSAAANTGLAAALIDKGDIKGSILAAREVAKLDPRSPTAHYNLGCVLAKAERLDEAIEEFREALKLDQTNAAAHGNLGYCLTAKGDWNGAIAAYREAIKNDPNNPAFQRNLSAVLELAGKAVKRP